jgi:hypothetical protein
LFQHSLISKGTETIDLKELLTIEMKKNVQYQEEILLEKQQKMNLEEQLKHYKRPPNCRTSTSGMCTISNPRLEQHHFYFIQLTEL